MTEKRLLLSEQSLLLKVAGYFAYGHFCQGDFNRVAPDGKVLRCPLSAIDMLGTNNRDRAAAKLRLAEFLAEIDPEYRRVYTNGKIDADETIIAWGDSYGLTHEKAADMVHWAATGVLQESDRVTAIATSDA